MAMANPHVPVTTDPTTTGTPPIPPLDPEEVREIQMLNEAVLVSFTATPDALTPFGRATLAWNITMPTTVIPGVHVEVHLYAVGDQVVDPQGSRVVAPYADTTYALSLRTPLASRQMETIDLAVDFGACRSADAGFISFVRDEANKAFPAGGQVKLRGDGSSVDMGYNSFVVDIPLVVPVPNWFDVDIDVSLGFSVSCQNGQISVTHNYARTEVSFGTATGIVTGGCSAAIAAALVAESNGFLTGFIGPVVADRIKAALTTGVNAYRDYFNQSAPPPLVPYQFYDLTLKDGGVTYRFCPAHAPSGPPHHAPGGGMDPGHI
jgi:hypothetical protein